MAYDDDCDLFIMSPAGVSYDAHEDPDDDCDLFIVSPSFCQPDTETPIKNELATTAEEADSRQGLPDSRQGLPDSRKGLPDSRKGLPDSREGSHELATMAEEAEEAEDDSDQQERQWMDQQIAMSSSLSEYIDRLWAGRGPDGESKKESKTDSNN